VALLGQTAYGPNSTVPRALASALIRPLVLQDYALGNAWALGVTLDAVQGGSGGLSRAMLAFQLAPRLTYTATGQLTPVGGDERCRIVVVGYFSIPNSGVSRNHATKSRCGPHSPIRISVELAAAIVRIWRYSIILAP